MMVDFLQSIHVEFEKAFCVGLSFIRVVTCQERLKGEKLELTDGRFLHEIFSPKL